MHYIIYLSSASHLFKEEELEDILKVSRRNNSANGITGILVYIDGSIVQLLEGPKEVVMDTYKRIVLDPRHSGFIKLINGDLEKRNFPDWSMGYRKISSREVEELTGHKDLSEISIPNVNGNTKHPAMVLLKSFLKHNRY